VVPGIGLPGLFVAAYVRFFWALSRRWKRLFATAGALYVAGGLGMELVGGGYASQYGEQTIAYVMIWTVEEVLEMVGIAVLIYALPEYMRAHLSTIRVSLDGREGGAEPIEAESRPLPQLHVRAQSEGALRG
jgi:hypothetical protein